MLEYIFLSVLSTSLSVGLIAILLMILAPFIDRRYAAKWKYLVWILLAVRLVMPIDLQNVQTFLRNIVQKPIVEENHAESEPITPTAQQTAPLPQRIVLEMPSRLNEPLAQSDEMIRITPLTILMSIWLAGSVIFLCIHLFSYLRYIRLLRHDGIRIKKRQENMRNIYSAQNKAVLNQDHVTLKLLRDLSDALRVPKKISIVKYAGADSPMVIGFLHPVLVLPAETYTDEALYYILKHELIHFKRHDVYWKLLFVLANAVHWFNPAVWLMHREAIVDMELSCDESVVSGADRKSRKAYTETLYSTLHQKCSKGNPLSTKFYGGKRIMQKRFRNILGRSAKRNGFYILACAVFLLIGAGLLIGCSVSGEDRLGQSVKTSGNLSDDEQSDITDGLIADGADDLRDQTEAEEATAPSGTDQPESKTLTYIMEGEPEEQTASLHIGTGYSIYVPDDEWEQHKPDQWQFTYNETIKFWVICYENSNMEQVQKELGDSQALLPDTESVRENEMTGQKGNMITRVRLVEQPEASRVWAVFYSYPEEAIEGAGARLPIIVDTFRVAEVVDINLWELHDSAEGAALNMLEFRNGLQLILPEEWMGKITLETSVTGQSVSGAYDNYRLTVYEKNNAEANYGGELIHLDYVRHDSIPYDIYGDKAPEIYRVLGVYGQEDQEYALIYAKYPKGGYDDVINISPDDPALQKDYQDMYALVDELQIITDHMPGFTECDVNDLDWIYIEGVSDMETNIS